MRNNTLILVAFLFNLYCNAQLLISTDTTYVKLSQNEIVKIQKYNDSISKIKIEADTITKYKIEKIIEKETCFIIYARGKAKDGNEYQYRIKSDKSIFSNNKIIKEGGVYQLDLRDYKNHNQRLHFIPGVALNLITHMGFSPFDIIIHLDEKITEDEFNIALNLKGLCLIKEE